MKREITCYETNNLNTLKFIKICINFLNVYKHKKIVLNEVAFQIWKMIQEDVYNLINSEMYFNKVINDIGYDDFMRTMFLLCYVVDQNKEDYIYYRDFKNIDSISLIGKPIYKFMNRIEEMLPYED